MTYIPPPNTLPASSQVSVLLSNPPVAPEEYINTLEYYISSNFEDAKTYQFITEISAIELISVSEIQNNLSLLSKAIGKYIELSQKYREILDRVKEISIEDNAKASTNDEEKETRSLETGTRVAALMFAFLQITGEFCDLLGEITNKYWNYLPSDFQDLIEDYAYSLQSSERFFNLLLEQINEPVEESKVGLTQFLLQIPHKIDFILDGIEQNSLKLQSKFPEREDFLESPRDSLQRAWGEFLEGKMLAISELRDEIASD